MSNISVNTTIAASSVKVPCQPIEKAIKVKGYPEQNAPTENKK